MWEFFLAHELHKFHHEIEDLPYDEFHNWILYFKQKQKLEENQMKAAQTKARSRKRR